MAVRNLLHKNDLDNFQAWLQGEGWMIQHPTPGSYEVLRAKKNGHGKLIIFRRAGAREHYSVPGKWDQLVYEYYRFKKGRA